MAFSCRVGTNWCHDFPKLARESGFHFNMHKSKVRVDWNRISSIDIERVICERDFWIVDENVNNVIDYSLESEYDVKILDPNFVKLFRLAQLAVEYLLYCKQYLDHSVIILKDELKLKIEENAKLKKQVIESEDTIVRLKEKTRDRSRLMETRNTDSSGEIHKCPHCPKTFVSAVFVNAHIARRHHYHSGLESSFSPVHDNYRAQTEQLNNEIKALKERLNQTEKVIRNESTMLDRTKLYPERRLSVQETESSKSDFEKPDDHAKYKSYHEDISNLKNMLVEEIKNLRQRSMYDHSSEPSVQTLINQQEKEFQKLRTQLLERLTPDIENMQSKLQVQEDYWKSKLEHLESEHRKDTERLLGELKLTQKLSDSIKLDYESKIHDLEQQTLKQSSILLEQSSQLKKLSDKLSYSKSDLLSKGEIITPTSEISKLSVNHNEPQDYNLEGSTAIKQVIVEDKNSVSSIDSVRKVIPVQKKIKKSKTPLRLITDADTRVPKKARQVKSVQNFMKESDSENEEDRREVSSERTRANQNIVYLPPKNAYISNNGIQKGNSKNSDKIRIQSSIAIDSEEFNTRDSSDTKTDSLAISSQSEYESESESPSLPKHKTVNRMPAGHTVKTEIQETIQQKLRDLGIDPEWYGIPNETFKQKMDIIKHHSKISAKKFPKYNQIKLNIIDSIRNKLIKKNRRNIDSKSLKASSFGDLVPSVTMKSMTTIVDQKDVNGLNSKLGNAATIRSQHREGKQRQTPDTNGKNNTNRMNDRIIYVSHETNSYENDSVDLTPKSNGSISGSNDEGKGKLVKNHDDSMNIPADIYQSFLNQIEDKLEKSISVSEGAQLRSTSTPIARQPFFVKPAPRTDRIALKSHENIVQGFLNSPKNNKSVLKSSSESTNSLIKKKVNFDLNDEEIEEIQFKSDKKQNSELQEKSTNATNIILKTSQSNKIAEISRKIEEQLNMTRHQPVGSVETIFVLKQSEEKSNNDPHEEQIATPNTDSLPQSPLQSTRGYSNSLPLPAPRNVREKTSDIVSYNTDDYDLNSDIDEILKIE